MKNIEQEGMRRRTFLGGASAASVGAILVGNGWADAAAFFTESGVDLRGLTRAGFELRHTSCMQCGALCGLSAIVNTMAKPGEKGFFVFGNQNFDHPQRGMCGRGATSPQTWDSPLRLKKPLKLVGPRGSGEFKEISWEQALTEIADRMKGLIDESGAESICFTGHNLATTMQWLMMGLGAPNYIPQSSTCNTAGVVARKWMMGSAFSHHAAVDPDYDRVRFVLFPGRTLHAPIGAQHRLAKAKAKGARAAFLNPAHPDSCFAGGEWISCRPGTDAAFLLGVAHVLVKENLYDADFVRRYTNLPFLLKADGHPLTAADLEEGGDANSFRVIDAATGAPAAHDDASVTTDMTFEGSVAKADGSTIEVTTAWNRFVAHLEQYTPAAAAAISDTPEETVVRMARTLANTLGVVEDTWYNTRNGNDTDAIMAIMTVNGLLGNIDKAGGMCLRASHGLPGVISRDAEGVIKTRLGAELALPKVAKRLDQQLFPETNGTFEAVVKSVVDGDAPYPIRALFNIDATIFHRDPNTARIEDMLRKLDLVVTTDILHQEVCDWSDYVLPSDMFLERDDLHAIGWSLAPAVALDRAVTEPPAGADVRPMEWIGFQILKRIYPDRAAALGWEEPFEDPKVFKTDFLRRIEAARIAGLAKHWELDPQQLSAELETEGFKIMKPIKHMVVPYEKPFASPSGRLEIYAFHPVEKGYREHGFARHIDPPAYTLPTRVSEFYLVSGKSPSGSCATAALAFSSQYLAENAVWVNPIDAEFLEVADGDMIELTGLDVAWTAQTKVRVTPRVHRGVIFTFSYVGGNRQPVLQQTKGFERIAEGINPHWFATSRVDPTTGSNFNNSTVRARRVIVS
ncbi:MAG: molybdopterin-dependent oxidoreductase [Rubrimonas sp.]